ncbi:uncharacterized protein LOC134612298 [Pelobates fuscus]|uniref:uncharacterized protein LOC134612298 n=1 Tax=Pelobates fuscus TaxID=191477 RepID=UPI002FE4D0DA
MIFLYSNFDNNIMILATGLLLLLGGLLKSNHVSCEPMVKMKLCSDLLDIAFDNSLKIIASSELRKMIGDFSLQPQNTNNGREKKRGRSKVKNFLEKIMNKWRQKQQSVWITASSVSFEDVSSQIVSNKSIIVTFKINIEFEEKTSSSFNGQSKNQPPILSVNVQMTSTFNLEKDKNGFKFTMKKCEVSINDIELIGSEEDDFETDNLEKLLEMKVCSLLPLLADNMNRLFMNILNIDPTGFNKLIVKSIKQSSAICLELDLNLVVNNVERISEGEHGYMLGNAISLLKGYTNYMLSVNAHAEMLNKILASKDFTLTPEELQLVIHDILQLLIYDRYYSDYYPAFNEMLKLPVLPVGGSAEFTEKIIM